MHRQEKTPETSVSSEPEKKRHHYIPVTYLEAFTNTNGMVTAYLKDDPSRPFEQKPENIAFHKYYYSQPLPGGGQDNNTLENFFSTVESTWSPFVKTLRNGGGIDNRAVENFVAFMTLMRIRVPAARDMIEFASADILKHQMRDMDAKGELPPRPEGLELEDIAILIDPHMSIHAMPTAIEGFTRIWDDLEYEVVHNKSGTPFITSDNPVIYFDPSVPEGSMLPYTVRPPFMPVELLFPVAPDICIRGFTAKAANQPKYNFRAYATRDGQAVKRINRLVTKFAYRFVFADSDHCGPLVKKHAGQSPTLEKMNLKTEYGEMLVNQMVFGKRRDKLKWEQSTVRLKANAVSPTGDAT